MVAKDPRELILKIIISKNILLEKIAIIIWER